MYLVNCTHASFLYADIVFQGTWSLLEELKDPDLKGLACRLSGAILHSLADCTVKKYLRAFVRWKSWATPYEFNSIPAKPHQFVLYLQHLNEISKSKAAVEEAVSWMHSCAGSPSDNPFVKTTIDGLQGTLAKPTIKKRVMEMLEAIVTDAQQSGSLSVPPTSYIPHPTQTTYTLGCAATVVSSYNNM